MDKSTSQQIVKALHHLAGAVDRACERLVLIQEQDHRDKVKPGQIVVYAKIHPAYAKLIQAKGPSIKASTWDELYAHLGTVAACASGATRGPEGESHDGQREAARELLKALHDRFPTLFPSGIDWEA
jgi:hypothetical protein